MKKILLLLLGASIISAVTTTGIADSEHDKALNLKQSGNIMPLEAIIAIAKSTRPGKILETELEQKGNTYIYELELLDAHGQVWEMTYNAKSGELIKDEQED